MRLPNLNGRNGRFGHAEGAPGRYGPVPDVFRPSVDPRSRAPYHGWRIFYRFHPESLFDYGGDRLSLARSYAESLRSALVEQFPGAEVAVDWSDALDPGADSYVCVQWDGGAEGHGMTREILDGVIYISDKIYYEGKFCHLS